MPAHRSSPLACFYSATLAWNQTAVDTLRRHRANNDEPYCATDPSLAQAP
jgi:hypothetical protein